jgi:hypothetical protein
MAKAGVGRVIPDRVSPPPKTPPPMFTPPPPPPMFSIPPRFTTPPYFVPPPPPPMFSIPPPAAREQASSRAAFEASGMSLTQYMRTVDGAAPPPPMFTPKPPPPPMFVAKPDPIRPPGLPQTPDAIDEWLKPDPGEEDQKPPVVNPEPSYPTPPPPPPPPPKIKVAPIDTVLFDDDAVPKEIIADLLFESIGGQEILTIARHDTVNGQTVLYQPIKNINILQQQYNPNNLLKLRDTSNTIFGNFTINLASKIPQVGNGTGGANTYLDAAGDLVIEFVSLANDELVEVQITSSGTIYEAG